MNMEKIKNVIKSKTGVGIIGFLLGAMLISSGTGDIQKQLTESKGQVQTLESQLKESETNLEDITTKLKTSEDKLVIAKPYFDMKAEEQKQLQAKVDKEKADKIASDKAKADADAKAKLEAKTKTLSNGNYIAGKDFDAGTYNISVVSGNGNVSSDNIFDGGINAIMGVRSEEMYQKEYKNVKLPKDVTLTISNVTIKLTPVQ